MDKNFNSTLFNRLIKRWGSQKFVAVVALSSIGAGITCLVSAYLIPNEPEPEETKIETKSTKSKKENV